VQDSLIGLAEVADIRETDIRIRCTGHFFLSMQVSLDSGAIA